jgi:5-methylcytosine-specific restriction endonuclease McrA
MKRIVLVEVDASGEAIRIFRTAKAAAQSSVPQHKIEEQEKAIAVRTIRHKVFELARNRDGLIECEECGKFITWDTGHMHEVHARGKRDKDGTYGEVSVDNCVAICASCHIGPNGAHGDRKWGGR